MLKSLTIKNYALIDEMHIEFGNGLNILTGETGAGKSLIIGALGFLLGEKARTDVVRKGASMAVVEGLFQIDEPVFLKDVQELVELDCRELLLRRELHVTGRSRSFANDSVIALNTLLSIGDRLIDLHGQHDHQTLLKVQNHLSFIDN